MNIIVSPEDYQQAAYDAATQLLAERSIPPERFAQLRNEAEKRKEERSAGRDQSSSSPVLKAGSKVLSELNFRPLHERPPMNISWLVSIIVACLQWPDLLMLATYINVLRNEPPDSLWLSAVFAVVAFSGILIVGAGIVLLLYKKKGGWMVLMTYILSALLGRVTYVIFAIVIAGPEGLGNFVWKQWIELAALIVAGYALLRPHMQAFYNIRRNEKLIVLGIAAVLLAFQLVTFAG